MIFTFTIHTYHFHYQTTMSKFSTGLLSSLRADVKTGLAVLLAEPEQKNLFIINGQVFGPVTKGQVVNY